MSLSIKILTIVITALLCFDKAHAQLDSCDATVPYFYIDMTTKPDSVWMSPNISRVGQCCGETHPDECISFEILLDSNTAGIQIDMIGADPAGSLFYDIDCEGNIPGGMIKCISGTGVQKITFCKPGNNKNIYIISAIAKPTFPNTDTVRIGCSKKITTFGLVDSTITWNSIFPSASGTYNSYLSCIDCKAPIYTPAADAPEYVDYEICGFPIADECGFVLTVCDTVRVYNFDSLEIDITPDSATFCDLGGGSGVNLTALPSGGDGNYTLIWRDSAGVQVGSGLNYLATFEGDFSLELFDGLKSSTCPSVFLNFHVFKGLLPVVDAGNYDKACGSDPSISLQGSVSGSNNAFWSGGLGVFSPDSTSLTASYTPSTSEINNGYVKLYLTSINPGCYSVIDSTTILISDTLKALVSDKMLLCNNDKTTLTLSVTGGTAPFSFLWSGGSTNDSLFNVGVGTYYITVTDSNGCSSSDSITVSQPDSISTSTFVISNYNGQDISCYGVSDGSALVTSSGGTGVLQYIWSNGSNNDSLMNVSEGTYSVTVFDINGCSAINSVTITQPDSISVSFLVTHVSCNAGNDGTITSLITGGTPGFTYQWSGPGLFTSSLKNLIGLAVGTYNVVITDTNGCLKRRTNIVTEPTAIVLSSELFPVNCYGGSDGVFDLLISGGTPGYIYSWTSLSGYIFVDSTLQNQSNLPAGSYTATVTDLNSCVASITESILQPNPLSLTSEVSDAKCYDNSDGDIAVTTFGGIPPYSYIWSIGETSSNIDDLPAGTYTVVVSDANNCILRKTFIITEPDSLFVSLYSNILNNGYNITYFNGSDGQIDASVIGGTLPYSFIWSNGSNSEDIDNLTAGTYTLTVEDSNNCSIFFSITLTQPSGLRMPNGFTPNSDGSNDNFVIIGIDAYPINSFTVYNRWGDIVFKKKNYSNTWFGKNMDDENLPEGTYFAILRIDREDITLKGYIDLRR